MRTNRKLSLIMFSVYFFCALAAFASEDGSGNGQKNQGESKASTESELVLERVQVVGSAENAAKNPGSAHFVTKEELARQDQDDIHRVLRDIPGVNIQEEDGFGLRPNIGMRGTGVERSQKITVMEDGVLIAPAPYTAPSAYYFPTTGRMESVEVLKGSSSVKQGPYTNGGSLNLISSSIPGSLSANLSASAGSHNTQKFKASIGDSKERFGWLVEGYKLDSAGFKDLDNGGDTGVDLKDFTGKFRVNSGASANVYQSLEIKIGKTTQFGEETYLGLTEADFAITPNRRYAGSAEDYIDTDHEQYQLRYFIKPTINLDITTTVYNNDFYRNWHKLQSVNGLSASSVLADPSTFANDLAVLRGDVDSGSEALAVRNNRRNYYSRGIQTLLHYSVSIRDLNHQLEIGGRYHEDEEDRFQNEEFFRMENGDMILERVGAPGSQTNRVSNAEALSFFIQDAISFGAWTVKPGLRYEKIDYSRIDYSKTDPERLNPGNPKLNQVEVFLPGMGIDYQVSSNSRIFLGVHKGFSPPGAGKNEETKEEESLNYELGIRHNSRRFHLELIGFFNDYDNLLGTETVAGGGSSGGDVFNGGQVEVSGLEAGLGYDFKGGAGVSLPFQLTYTYTQSEFLTTFDTSFEDWGPHVEAGDELPYIPEQQITAKFGFEKDHWRADLAVNYSGEIRTTAGQGAIPEGEGIEDRTVLDLSGSYSGFKYFKVFAHIRNLTDEVYLASRRPAGLRPGLERTVLVGASAKF